MYFDLAYTCIVNKLAKVFRIFGAQVSCIDHIMKSCQEHVGEVHSINANSCEMHTFCVLLQSPDGKYLASGAIDGIINIFDIATGKLLHTLEGNGLCICNIQVVTSFLNKIKGYNASQNKIQQPWHKWLMFLSIRQYLVI